MDVTNSCNKDTGSQFLSIGPWAHQLRQIQFTPEEADTIVDALLDYQASQVEQRVQPDANLEERELAYRRWQRAEEAIRKIREA